MTTIREAFAIAVQHHQAGHLAEAENIYRQILAVDGTHAHSLHLLGVIAYQVGRTDAAIDTIGRAIALNGSVADFHNNLGLALQAEGRLAEAAACCAEAVRLDPDYADAHMNLGTLLQAQGRLDEAVAHYTETIRLQPDSAEAHMNLGNVLKAQGKLDEAVAHYGEALRLRPDYAEAHYNLGLARQAQGSLEEAADRYAEALRLRPDFAETHNNLGNVFKAQGRLEEAAAHYGEALRLRPDYAEAHSNLGLALRDQGRLEEAVAHGTAAVGLKPDYAEAFMNLGLSLQDQGRLDEAVARFGEAIRLKPSSAEAHLNLGLALQDQGRVEEAAAHYREALSLRPDYAEARFGLCMAQLPVLYDSEAEIEARRGDYEHSLQDLCRAILESASVRRDAVNAVGVAQPFYLPYQGRNDRELQAVYGGLLARIMADRYPPVPVAGPPGPGEPVRVGFVSGFFRRHSIWKIPLKGWLTQLDRRRFRLFGYHTRAEQDAETAAAASLLDRFVQGPLPLERWREEILADAPHVLIYPELGMEPMAVKLAALRLARVQCLSLGHPTTSGLPTMDCFLSSDLMEPAEAEQHYTERLVRLPNLSIFYEPPDPPVLPLTRAELGLRPGATVYWCCQSLFKYLPQFDQVFPRIAREVGDCQFAFIRYAKGRHVDDLFAGRLERAFAGHGLAAGAHCVFLPELSMDRFSAAAGLCDVYLDSIGWAGFNSTLESLHHDLPVVTLPGPLMRGRHTLAILQRMGVTETVAATLDAYVALAVRLGQDAAWRAAIRQRIAESRHRLYRDRECIAALEDVLERAARGPAGG